MNQKFALTLAAAITAFALVVGGAIAGRQAIVTAAAPTPTTADIQSLYAEREAAYRAQLDAANKALAEAYAQQNNASSAAIAAPQAQDTVPSVAISPQDAISAALNAVPGAKTLNTPELVNYQGIVAYEVKLDVGMVYIDANSGAVLYNGAVQAHAVAPARRFDDDHEDDDD